MSYSRMLSSLSDASESIATRRRIRHVILVSVAISIIWIWQTSGILSTQGLTKYAFDQSIESEATGWERANNTNWNPAWTQGLHQTEILNPNSRVLSKIGKVTSLYYERNTHQTRTYEDALQIHEEHDLLWGYKHYIQRRGDLGFWSKPAYLQAIITSELSKSPSERLQWLFWHDADIILMNTLINLETFLPPNDAKFENINLIMSNDINGLNNGAFFIRVCEESVYFLAATLAYRHYRPTSPIRLYDQGAMNNLLGELPWNSTVLHVPQNWFNAFQGEGQDETIPPEWHHEIGHFTPGGLLVHLAGVTPEARPGSMDNWISLRTLDYERYTVPLAELDLTERVKVFWTTEFDTEHQRMNAYWRQYWIIRNYGPPEDRKREKAEQELRAEMAVKKKSQEQVDMAVKRLMKKHWLMKQSVLRKTYLDMIEGRIEDHTNAI